MDNETIEHSHPEAENIWNTELHKLETWMRDHDGCSDMVQAIGSNFRAWKAEVPIPHTEYSSSILNKAVRRQNMIGRKSFIDGFITKEWIEYQTVHLRSIQSRKSPYLWMSRLQHKIW